MAWLGLARSVARLGMALLDSAWLANELGYFARPEDYR